MKKIILSILLVCMLGCVAEAKEGEINMTGQIVMKINNSKAFVNTLETAIDYNDNTITPIVENDVVFIPVRFVAQHRNCRVEWVQENNLVIIDKENNTIQISINSNIAIMSGREISLKYQPKLINSRTYIEINDLAGLLECLAVVENEFIVLGTKTDTGDIPTVGALEAMYREYPNTHGSLYPIYKPLSATEHGLVANIGFMDKNGTMVIEPTHTIVGDMSKYFYQGLYCTSKEIINEKGEVLYKIPYSNIAKAYPPKDGIISILKDYPLTETDALPIYLDMNFRDITHLVTGKDFNSGLNLFKKDGLWYAENKSGNIVIEFPNGVQNAEVVTVPITNAPPTKSYILFVQMGKMGVMNLDGMILLDPTYDRIKVLANDKFAMYESGKVMPTILDSAGQPAFQFNDIEIVEINNDSGLILTKEGAKFKVFSNEGELLLNTNNTDMSFVYDLIYFKNGAKCGYMDYKFNVVYEW